MSKSAGRPSIRAGRLQSLSRQGRRVPPDLPLCGGSGTTSGRLGSRSSSPPFRTVFMATACPFKVAAATTPKPPEPSIRTGRGTCARGAGSGCNCGRQHAIETHRLRSLSIRHMVPISTHTQLRATLAAGIRRFPFKSAKAANAFLFCAGPSVKQQERTRAMS